LKLAACYTAFNACELLKPSIKQIYNYVDVIIISYQDVSNTGNPILRKDADYIKELMNDDKIVFLKFNPDLKTNPKVNERAKLQQRIDKAKQLNCTHYFGAATDHFYKPHEFIYAKNKCLELDVDVTLTKMFTYYKEPTYQLKPIEDYLCPFICKIYPSTKVVSDNNYEVRVDPSVRISPAESFYIFEQYEIMLHHHSMVRDNIRSKFENAAASQNWKHKIEGFIEEHKNARVGDSISYFKNRKIVEVPNYFKIQIKK